MFKKTFITIAILFMLSHIVASPFNGRKLKSDGQISQKSQIAFTENKGQFHDQYFQRRSDILYGTMSGNMALHIKNSGVSYQLYRVDSRKDVKEFNTNLTQNEVESQTIYRVDLEWVNANSNFTKTEDELLPGYCNYYFESCPDGARNVKSYSGITLRELYEGIDLHYYDKNGEVEYDYIVKPGFDYKKIKIKVNGARVSLNSDGSVTLETPLGRILECAPKVFQNGIQLKAGWIIDKNVLSFNIENYDPRLEVIIDPVTRLWGSYYGAAGGESGNSTCTDPSGNIYIAGQTTTGTGSLLATSGAHQTVFGGGTDAFLVKFSSTGLRLWGTYYGGSGSDFGFSCALDANGNVYLAGRTSTTGGTVIANSGSHQPLNGGGNDAFLVQFNASGIRQWGTYYGGAAADYGRECVTDISGNVYLAGYTSSNSGTEIATPGSHQATNAGGTDAFLVKFNSSGVRQWGTYYGGALADQGLSCCTDPSGNIYLSGFTNSSSGSSIGTNGAHQAVFGGTDDAFLVKFNSSGTRQWGTYYGGSGSEYGNSCTSDVSGNVIMTGFSDTNTGTVIATNGSHQSTFGGGGSDAFVVMFNTTGSRLWGTYYGGSGTESGISCRSDATGNIILAGYSDLNTGTVITTSTSYQSTYGGGAFDGIIVKFTGSGSRLWGSWYGGSGDEYVYGCGTDLSGSIFLTGASSTSVGTTVATSNAFQSSFGGGSDAFIVKFVDCFLQPVAGVNATICESSPINFSTSVSGTILPIFSWVGPNSFTSNLQNPSIPGAGTLQIGVYTVTTNKGGCLETATTQVVSISPQPVLSVNSGTICAGQQFAIVANGAFSYTYSGGSTVSPSVTTSYSVLGTGTNGCVTSTPAISNVNVNPNPTITATSTSSMLCVGETATLSVSGGLSYTYQPGGNSTSVVVSPTITTNYTVSGSNQFGCIHSTVITQNVDNCLGVSFSEKKDVTNLVKVYPNPASGVVCVELGFDSPLVISNTLGQVLFESNLSMGRNQIDLSTLSRGIYFVRLVHSTHPIVCNLAKF